ncbi:nuclear transport factor 2 family protein [Chryseobacterium culicis]|uniref:SnoaL-like domain-containing protein n=1 Tax=Chryseobacterium culicis TaxID=680127 RepID=A0A1H6ING2_CHRCI|nr:nuclear transport factor 2 family protein [Chryseobacterium culicis]SEH47832.1 SnoaL-like domain-containing protein [Chryseobacterium culicis]
MEIVERIISLEDKLAIKELNYSYLFAADRKDHDKMAAHFTSDGVLTSIMDEGTIVLKGTKGISDGFAEILKPIQTAYHLGGQLLIDHKGEEVTGKSYVFVTLVGLKDNLKYVRKIWAVYEDEYSKKNNQWFIKNRVATVAWEEKDIINN